MMLLRDAFVYFVFSTINFYYMFVNTVGRWVDQQLNLPLEGYTLYYGMYSEEEKYYARLYDYRSLWARLYLTLMNLLYGESFIKRRLFQYDAVSQNLTDLHNFSISAIIVVVVKHGDFEELIMPTDLHNAEEAEQQQEQDLKFVYVIVESKAGQIDMTRYVNKHINDIVLFKSITYIDVFNILTSFYSLPQVPKEITVKACSDINFKDVVFKGSDSVDITPFFAEECPKILSHEKHT